MKFQKNYVYLLDNAGLGNQLYMLAYADYIRQQGYPTSILYKQTEIGSDTKDSSKRNILLDIPKKLGFEVISYDDFSKNIFSRICNFFGQIYKHYLYFDDTLTYLFLPKIESRKLINIYYGYFQSPHYISKDFLEKVSKILSSMVANENKFSITPDDIAIHLRRGDYLTVNKRFRDIQQEELFYILDADYYLRGLDIISEKRGKINKVYIFSDDFPNIQNEIRIISEKYDVVLVEGQSVLQDITTMKKFNNYVLANSTFAWWGAMLSEFPKPLVVVPEKTLNIKDDSKDHSQYPPEWIKL